MQAARRTSKLLTPEEEKQRLDEYRRTHPVARVPNVSVSAYLIIRGPQGELNLCDPRMSRRLIETKLTSTTQALIDSATTVQDAVAKLYAHFEPNGF